METGATPERLDPRAPDRRPLQQSAQVRLSNDADRPSAQHPKSDRKTWRQPIPAQEADPDITRSVKRRERLPPVDTREPRAPVAEPVRAPAEEQGSEAAEEQGAEPAQSLEQACRLEAELSPPPGSKFSQICIALLSCLL